MKIKWIGVTVMAISLAAIAVTSMGQPKIPIGTKEFMREKLEHSQKVLEGLALEDFSIVVQHSRKLSAMSQSATWQVFQNPDYAQYSASFRRNVEGLTKAAEDKNLDGATLAYLRVTMSCVECHKFVRGKLVAKLD